MNNNFRLGQHNRREFLTSAGGGFGMLGLAGLLLVSFLINGGWKRERQTTTSRIIKSGNTGSADTE